MKKGKNQSAKTHPQEVSFPRTLASIRKRLRRRKDRFNSLRAIERFENARGPVTEQQLAEFARLFRFSAGERAMPRRD